MQSAVRAQQADTDGVGSDAVAERYLAAVSLPVHFLDRRQEPFVPVYLELMRPAAASGSAGPERVGYGLSGSVAVFYSVLIQLTGSPSDGRRQSRGELDGNEKFAKRALSAGYLAKRYRWTYDQIAAWAATLGEPRLCPHCGRAHALLRVEHRNGHRNTYTIVRCQDLRDDECLARAMVDRVKRVPTGAADPRTRVLRDDPQVALPLDGLSFQPSRTCDLEITNHAQTVGQSPMVPAETAVPSEAGASLQDHLQTVGQRPMVFNLPADSSLHLASSRGAQTLGESPTVCADVERVPEVLRGRLRALEGFCIIEQVEVPSETLMEIAREIADPGELYSALVSVLGAASINAAPIDSVLVRTVLGRRVGDTAPGNGLSDGRARESSTDDDADWSTGRVLELARLAEAETTPVKARRIRDEFFAKCLAHEDGDREAAARVLERVLTDPRCCGTIGKREIKKPIAVIRDGFADGWIWTDAASDTGEGRMARVFARDFTPLQQAEVQRIYQAFSAGSPLDIRRLNDLHVGSRPMLAYLAGRFAPDRQTAHEAS